jgi:phage baseplate assembly protein V
MIDAINRALTPLRVRVANMLGRAVVKLVDDAKKTQIIQVVAGPDEVRELERFQEYGFSSVPLDGAEAVAVFVGGRRDHGFVIATDDRRYRLTGLQAGEVAIYHKDGASVLLKADGSIAVTPKSGAIVQLAGNTNPVAKGDSLNTAIANLGTAIASAMGSCGAPNAAASAAAVTTAVSAFNTAATAALSTKVKLS